MALRRARGVFTLLLATCTGCGSGEEDDPGARADEIRCGDPGVLCYEFGPIDVPPGGEWQGFQAIDAGFTEDRAIVSMEIDQVGAVSHHFTVSLWNDPTPPDLGGPFDLFTAEGLKFVTSALGQTLVGSVFKYVRIDTGDYVGVSVPAEAYIVNSAHYLNAGSEAATGHTIVRIRTVPKGEVRFATTNDLPGTTAIDVAPGATETVEVTWNPPNDVAVLLLTSHMHRHGKLFEAWKTVSGVEEKVYSTTNYDAPPLNFYTGTAGNPPIVLRPALGDHLRFACTHENFDLTTPLTYGPYADTSEMCVLPLYYLNEPDAFLELVASGDGGQGFTYELIPNGN